jgi:hypothetical protein
LILASGKTSAKEFPMNPRTKEIAGYVSWKLAMLILVVSFLIGFAVWRATHLAESMPVVAGSVKDLQQAKPEDKTKIVVEVEDEDQQGTIHGKLLQKKTEEIYTRTGTAMVVQSSAETKMVMGKREDVHKSAVIHVTGSVRADKSISAEQIVILTGYVKVE